MPLRRRGQELTFPLEVVFADPAAVGVALLHPGGGIMQGVRAGRVMRDPLDARVAGPEVEERERARRVDAGAGQTMRIAGGKASRQVS